MDRDDRKAGNDLETTKEGDNPEHSIPRDSKTRISKYEAIELDEWQKEVLDYKGNIALRAGRQVGKSTITSIKAGDFAVNNPKSSIMIISATERQAYLLFLKVLNYLHDNYRSHIKRGKDRPTKTELKLTNGSIIRCLPTGMDGLGIRGYTINVLIADEAAFINKDVWQAVTPMLATTGGKIILLSTPFGKEGYFFNRFQDTNFKQWHISSEVVAESREEPQRTFMKSFQEDEKKSMTSLQYAQEYLGEFVDEMRQMFPDELIKKCCTLKRGESRNERYQFFLGVDIARMGDDKSSFQVIKKLDNRTFEHIESVMTSKTKTTDTFDRILSLNQTFNFKHIGIDAGSGSLGVGVLDFLLREPKVRSKIVALNNIARDLDRYGERKRTILKFDMYMNLKAMMEMGVLKLLKDDEVVSSLRAIQFEYNISSGKKSNIHIFASRHSDTDLVEGLMRAAWLANRKNINSFINYF